MSKMTDLEWFEVEKFVTPPIVRKLKRLEAQLAACEWISVDERLPDDNEWVLLGGGDVICEQGVRRNDEFYLTRTDSYDEYIRVYPTHWMPLPNPPQQGKP